VESASAASDFSEDVVLLMGGLADMEVKAEVGEHEVVAVHVDDEAAVDIDAIPDKQFRDTSSPSERTPRSRTPAPTPR